MPFGQANSMLDVEFSQAIILPFSTLIKFKLR